jgi:hypothetical protein
MMSRSSFNFLFQVITAPPQKSAYCAFNPLCGFRSSRSSIRWRITRSSSSRHPAQTAYTASLTRRRAAHETVDSLGTLGNERAAFLIERGVIEVRLHFTGH